MTRNENRGRILALIERLNWLCELYVMITSLTGVDLEQDRMGLKFQIGNGQSAISLTLLCRSKRRRFTNPE
jgi:hypothetical protein